MRDDGRKSDYIALTTMNKIFSQIRQISKNMEKLISPLADAKDMTVLQLLIVLTLAGEKDKRISIGDLGELVGITAGNISNITRKIEEKGYIKRVRSSEDERVVDVQLTEEGQELCKQVDEYLVNVNKKLDKEITVEELEKFGETLNRFSSTLTLSIYLARGSAFNLF